MQVEEGRGISIGKKSSELFLLLASGKKFTAKALNLQLQKSKGKALGRSPLGIPFYLAVELGGKLAFLFPALDVRVQGSLRQAGGMLLVHRCNLRA